VAEGAEELSITVLRSGSKGNATLFTSGSTRILVDAGISPRALTKRLKELDGKEGGTLTAVVVTHAHRDHVGHASRIAQLRGIPVWLSEATARHVSMETGVETRVFHPRTPFVIGGLTLAPLPLPHDAAQVAFRIDNGHRSAALATDLGEVPKALLPHFEGCGVVLLESNHDTDMLARGPYPPFLKDRIASARGHLSNVQTAEVLAQLPASVRAVVLLHLSETNNEPSLAEATAKDALAARQRASALSFSTELHLAEQDALLRLDVPARPLAPAPAQLVARAARPVPRQLSLFDALG
jgi:phosphoribosyl 1,2-cyclic phosphodiesterase